MFGSGKEIPVDEVKIVIRELIKACHDAICAACRRDMSMTLHYLEKATAFAKCIERINQDETV